MNCSRWVLTLTLAASLLAPALAQTPKSAKVQVTMSGTVESLDTSTGMLVLKREDGTFKKAHLIPTCQYKSGDRNVTAAAFPQGRKIAIRLCSAINENPVQVDLVCDWFSSKEYVATHAPAPYTTRMGDFATTNGVGGSSPGMPEISRPDHTIGILGNGGKVVENPLQGMPTNQGARMAMAQNMMNAEGVNAASILTGQDPENGTGGPGGGTGVPVNMQAQVVRFDPGSHALVVCPVGSQVPQSIMLGASVNVPLLQPGTLVTIIGQTNPSAGYIEATNVVPMNAAHP